MILVFVRKTTQKPCSHISLLRWILKILHDPKYLIPWGIIVLLYTKVMQDFCINCRAIRAIRVIRDPNNPNNPDSPGFWIELLQPFLL